MNLYCVRFKKEFHNWTSGNNDIDKFIQQMQLHAKKYNEIIEWIPFNKFTNIEYLSRGGFGVVYKATWTDGYIYGFNSHKNAWKRSSQMNVCLKRLYNSNDINKDFLEEVKNQHKYGGDSSIAIYGITKNPQDNDYTMVMQYAKKGSLRKLLDSRYHMLNWICKIDNLRYISQGLRAIHKAKLVHKDLHSGNIVNQSYFDPYITDFGLCKPVSQDSGSKEFFGVLPYVAPELLKALFNGDNIVYTQESDIYSFGIIMSEIINGYPPYYDFPHNTDLALKILEGQRPEIKCEVPQLLLDLMNRCLDDKPKNRPYAKELVDRLKQYQYDITNEKTELYKQIKAIKTEKFPAPLIYKIHEQASYKSQNLSKTLKNFQGY
ncbi:kinase-like domain-containing protein [Gigaspora rosea]|uniref:Kinase-like domain-containing protein n=1 Tax=Gigaspora rosea TaxID=44941 RepID=A0A397V5U2_9GLOM|nr:kinase-like domain-containing protein [Gigaspora rosea]